MKTNSGFEADSQFTVLSLKQVYFKKKKLKYNKKSFIKHIGC